MAEIKDIFNFLKEYNDLTNPVITDLDHQIWSLDLSRLPRISEIKSKLDGTIEDGSIFLEVTKPNLEPCPTPNENIIDWIDDKWNRLSVEKVNYTEKKIYEKMVEDETIEEEIRFIDDRSRVENFDKWIESRNNWRENEIPKEKGLQLYNKLFKLYSDIKKDSESVELILGDGIVNWNIDERNLNHPIILQKMNIEFNPQIPKFVIVDEEIKTELYTAMLRVLSSVNQSMLTDVVKDVDSNDYKIHDFENTHSLYKRLINILDKNGEFVEKLVTNKNNAQIYSSPILFLRKRNLGYSGFLENIIEDIDEIDEKTLPNFFENLIGNHQEIENEVVYEEKLYKDGIDEDVLLTLPSNDEQLKIVKYLNEYDAVLVQGPPGTGKTHTIANLIGHLLSEGNSILVTSHTEKALKVLKDKVYKDDKDEINLQKLCISLLASRSQKKELDEAINEISSKISSLDIKQSNKKINDLKKRRSICIKELENLRGKILELRSSEYKDIVYDNTTLTPMDAAKFIRDGIGRIDYINGKTKDPTIGFPLNEEELYFLYNSNNSIELKESLVLSSNIPDINELLAPKKFQKIISESNRIKEEIEQEKIIVDLKKSIKPETVKDTYNLINKYIETIENYDDLQIFLLNKAVNDGTYKELWEDVFIEIEYLLDDFNELKKIKFEFDIEFEENVISNNNLEIINQIIDSGKENPLSGIGGLFKPKWKELASKIKNNNQNIQTMEEFKATKSIIEYDLKKKIIIKRINKLLTDSGHSMSYEDNKFEIKCINDISKMKDPVFWYADIWERFNNEFMLFCEEPETFKMEMKINYNNPCLSIKKNLIKASSVLKTRKNEMELKKFDEIWSKHKIIIEKYIGENEVIDLLIEAFIEKNILLYNKKYYKYNEIIKKIGIFNKRNKILNKIKIYAPEFAEEIRNRKGIHDKAEIPYKINDAWKWRQLTNQLDEFDKDNINILQKKLDKINENLLNNSRALAYEKAWVEKVKNITQEQIQSIEGWRTTIRQIGKGTGKNAPRLKKKARELMPKSQSAIPVWIMTLNRVVENFNPKHNKFDVIIIDEASQSDILALAALYIGKKIIIVGDDEQVSPSSIGIKKDEINSLIELYLEDIPNNHLFNGETSLYDMAKSSGFRPLMLTEHFRCLPEIIEFSNSLSYNGRIKPLRDSSNVSIEPALVEYRVKNGIRNDKNINNKEAKHIASLICAIVKFDEYKDKTVGVISMSGDKQDYEVERLLHKYLSPVEYENRNIQCGRPPQFQGDERDIIFISLVDGPNESGGPVRLVSEDGRNEMYRKRYNVAASRAKDQLWVVHSLNPEIDLKPDDIRLKLINHAKNPKLLVDEVNLGLAESPFEEEVMRLLMNKGYVVKPQVKVGSYRIDMVIEDGNNRIAIECDGEKWHTKNDLPNDIKRQAILERLGWRFIRIRGSAFYRNPDKTMQEVYTEIKEYKINPDFNERTEEALNNTIVEDSLIDKLKRRAEEIRNEWKEDLNDEIKIDELNEKNEIKKQQKQETIDIKPKKIINDRDNKNNGTAKEISKYNSKVKNNLKEKSNEKVELKKRKVKNIPRDKTKQKRNVIKEDNRPTKPIFDFRKKKSKE